jgi:NADP-dependent 3-hydroxy acid dehydrogenase YdfG
MLQSLSPGLVKTEMPSKEFLDAHPALNPEDIADGVLYVLGTPPHVQVRLVINYFSTIGQTLLCYGDKVINFFHSHH